MDLPPIGIVKINLESLEFFGGREIDTNIVENLVEVFIKSPYGCDRNHDLNVIPAYIDLNHLNHLLELSNISRADLQLSLSSYNTRPRLDTGDFKIRCLHGRHRVEAAKRFLGPSESWWTIRLYASTLTNSQCTGLSLKEGERFSHETEFSDGEIYCKVRYYQETQQEDLVEEWMLRLSKSKRRNLSWLLEHTSYTTYLDMLRDFPGIWSGFEMGNFRRHLVLRCDEELLRYLWHIYITWSAITLNDLTLRNSVDIDTARRLQGRTPYASSVDRQYIIDNIDSGILFPKLRDATTRRRIQAAILDLRVIIPTIKTFHENTKLLEICVQIIRREITDCRKGTLFDSLCNIWSHPSNCMLEIQEGIFCTTILPGNSEAASVDQFPSKHIYPNATPTYLAYFQIFLAVLRQFPMLGSTPPRRDIRNIPLQASIEPAYQVLLARRAKLLGFYNSKIQETENITNGGLSLHVPLLCSWRKRKDDMETRWGRPFGQPHSHLRRELFVQNLSLARHENSRKPSAMYVQQDFLRAFFRPFVFDDLINESVSLPGHMVIDLTVEIHQQRGAQQWESSINQRQSSHQQQQEHALDNEQLSISNQQTVDISISLDSTNLPAPTGNNFDVPREPVLSPTTTVITSRMSNVSRSPSVAWTARSSPRFQDLASQFMNTDIEIEEDGTINTDPEFTPTIISTQIPGDNVEREDSWVSENCSIMENEQASIAEDQPRRSFLESHYIEPSNPVMSSSRTRSFLKAQSFRHPASSSRLSPRPREQKLVPRKNRNFHRSFLRRSKSKKPTRRLKRSSSGPRIARSFLATSANRQCSPRAIRSPKGKGIMRDEIESQSRQGVRSFLIPEEQRFQVDESSRSPGEPSSTMAWATRSYSGPQAGDQGRSPKGKEIVRQVSPSTVPKSCPIEFVEYNGMKRFPRSTTNLDEYLKRRRGWIGMIVIDGAPRTIRLKHIAKYVENRTSANISEPLIIVKQAHAERIRRNYPM